MIEESFYRGNGIGSIGNGCHNLAELFRPDITCGKNSRLLRHAVFSCNEISLFIADIHSQKQPAYRHK